MRKPLRIVYMYGFGVLHIWQIGFSGNGSHLSWAQQFLPTSCVSSLPLPRLSGLPRRRSGTRRRPHHGCAWLPCGPPPRPALYISGKWAFRATAHTSVGHNNSCRLLAFLLCRFRDFLGCRVDARGLVVAPTMAVLGFLAVRPRVRRFGDFRLMDEVLFPSDRFEDVPRRIDLEVESRQPALVASFPVPDLHINEVAEHGVVYVAVIEWRIEDKRVVHPIKDLLGPGDGKFVHRLAFRRFLLTLAINMMWHHDREVELLGDFLESHDASLARLVEGGIL